jgi:hypothetical protein
VLPPNRIAWCSRTTRSCSRSIVLAWHAVEGGEHPQPAVHGARASSITVNAEENWHMLDVNEAVREVPLGYEGAYGKKVLGPSGCR